MGVSSQLHAPAALPKEKQSPRYSMYKRLDEHQNRSGRGGEDKNSLLYSCRESKWLLASQELWSMELVI
jgi:hypothetical protein